ncbi:hypothetical protein [Rossellomorea aquimaris]|uniref:PhoD-like phosphatase metallophosphatase domain-containing protein n=1 Tax=Rossellomorea aquimaris TaxID=189382 RepID=A0A1J6VW68_9BACI|nr:hypothetical protein [Rossellomorea aquimaris]OIU68620.1 hypothetical protein BHE18_16990 [Rossellomorea aquimaris]
MGESERPIILGGPILRRVEDGQAFIWAALSKSYELGAQLFEVTKNGAPAGFHYNELDCSTETRTIRAGKHLYICMIKVSPENGTFPVNTLIGYNLTFKSKREKFDLGDLGLLSPGKPQSIVYGYLAYPTFYINKSKKNKILYGSCRNLHGKGEDVFIKADQVISMDAGGTDRPSALFLIGNQIYADDVADSFIQPIIRMGEDLSGREGELGLIDSRLNDPLLQKQLNQINGRQSICENCCSFTSRKSANHLFTLGEYMVMYLLSWSPELWRQPLAYGMFEPFDELVDSEKIHFYSKDKHSTQYKREYKQLEKRYGKQLDELSNTVEALGAVRRVLANTPTYMIFDEHDITDGWNSSVEWMTEVREAPLGRHVVSNALAAYWLFQGWGNDPDSFVEFEKTMSSYLDINQVGSPEFEEWSSSLWNYDFSHFTAPTVPASVFLDCRILCRKGSEGTSSAYQSGVWEKVKAKLMQSGWKEGEPLILTMPQPVYGSALIETLPGVSGHCRYDFEPWRQNGKDFNEFIHKVGELKPGPCIILSGGRHFASAITSDITFHGEGNRSLTLRQFTSSPIKNMSCSIFKSFMMKWKIWMYARKGTERAVYLFCDGECRPFLSSEKPSNDIDMQCTERIRYLPLNSGTLIETKNNMGVLEYDNEKFIHLLI